MYGARISIKTCVDDDQYCWIVDSIVNKISWSIVFLWLIIPATVSWNIQTLFMNINHDSHFMFPAITTFFLSPMYFVILQVEFETQEAYFIQHHSTHL